MSKPNKTNRLFCYKGFTLIELILVMFIIFTIAGVVAPRFSEFFPSLQVRETTDRVYAWAHKVRSDAALTGTRRRFVFDSGARKYWIEYEPKPLKEPGTFVMLEDPWGEETLPEEVSFASLDGLEEDPLNPGHKYLEFKPDGTAADASIVVSHPSGGSRTIKVDAATSRVSMETPAEP